MTGSTSTSGLLDYVRRLIHLRQIEPVFRRRDFLAGADASGSGLPDVRLAASRRREMARRIGAAMTPMRSACSSTARRSPPMTVTATRSPATSFLLLFNAFHEPVTFAIPMRLGRRWTFELSTDPRRRAALAPAAGEPAAAGAVGRRPAPGVSERVASRAVRAVFALTRPCSR